jgi:hypothetical protein
MAQQLSPLDGHPTDSPNGTANGRCKRKGAPDENDDVVGNSAQLSPNSHKNNDLPTFSLIDVNDEVVINLLRVRYTDHHYYIFFLSFFIFKNILCLLFCFALKSIFL